MSNQNASAAEYLTPTPTCVQCVPPPPSIDRLPHTGSDLPVQFGFAGFLLVAGAVVAVIRRRWR